MKVLLFVLLMLGAQAQAACDNWWLGVGGPSKHSQHDANDNQNNFGLGLQKCLNDADTVRMVGQIFRNTQRIDSAAVGMAWSPWKFDVYGIDVKPGMAALGVVGYQPHVIYGVLPTVAFEGKYFGVDYVIAKEFGNDSGKLALVHWLNFKFNSRLIDKFSK